MLGESSRTGGIAIVDKGCSDSDGSANQQTFWEVLNLCAVALPENRASRPGSGGSCDRMDHGA